MGVDISTQLEVLRGGQWQLARLSAADLSDDSFESTSFPLSWRHMDMFSFLSCGINYQTNVPQILAEDRGLPMDSVCLNEEKYPGCTYRQLELEDDNNYGFSWLTLAELLAFDYEQPCGPTVEARSFPDANMRDFLGETFFNHLGRMKEYGTPSEVRLIFYFN